MAVSASDIKCTLLFLKVVSFVRCCSTSISQICSTQLITLNTDMPVRRREVRKSVTMIVVYLGVVRGTEYEGKFSEIQSVFLSLDVTLTCFLTVIYECSALIKSESLTIMGIKF